MCVSESVCVSVCVSECMCMIRITQFKLLQLQFETWEWNVLTHRTTINVRLNRADPQIHFSAHRIEAQGSSRIRHTDSLEQGTTDLWSCFGGLILGGVGPYLPFNAPTRKRQPF